MKTKTFALNFTANQLKWMALAFMTIDHLEEIVKVIPAIAFLAPIMKLLGRIAAPLFLFVLTESVRHTQNKLKFVLRLYIAGVGCGAFTILTNLIFREKMIYTPGNIFFTYFYTALYICLIENALNAAGERDFKKLAIFIAGIFSTAIPQLLYTWFDSIKVPAEQTAAKIFQRNILISILPPVLLVEYSLLFVLMGVLLYFLKVRKLQCTVFLCFCMLSFLGAFLNRDMSPFNDFFDSLQYWMILALPIIYMYNGEQGTPHKVFFYVYYPVHRYLISFLAALIKI